MTKKAINIGLLIIVVFIYGSIVIKCSKNNNLSSDTNAIANLNSNYSADRKMVKDTFQLNITQTSPFGVSKKRKTYRNSNAQNQSSNTKKRTPRSSSNSEIWPKINYYGFVKSEKKSTRLVLVKIGDRLYRKREKEEIDQIRIEKAYSDSLLVSFNRSKKMIKKVNEKK